MKQCKKCGLEKEFIEFNKKKGSKDGYRHECKICEKQYKKEHYNKNKDKIIEKQKQLYYSDHENQKMVRREYHHKNKEIIKIKQKEYREQNKDILKQKNKEYQEKNKEKYSITKRNYYEKNKHHLLEYSKQFHNQNKFRDLENQRKRRTLNPEKFRSYARDWARKNKGYIRARNVQRRIAVKQASINYQEYKNSIMEIYANCPEGYHVDHIVPLRGVNVCGLHVPWNLQYLSAEDNLKKGNKYV